ncbi:hypothetical protein JF729_23845 [Mycobacterium intracellulare]|uniref:hypothetical protein n=1 Tax=Mycobacterium intracellulare TaxID=1767 RepID=UPI001CD9AC2D|nr:hypothetical protein [Mycobacterium intracellulare]MCA2250817.1 hypothetical protein [Mycobacterium intracellulare]
MRIARQDEPVAAHEFRNDDPGYATWLATHRTGYVLNIAASHSPTEAKVHHAPCSHIAPRRGKSATGSYTKVCAVEVAELEQWAAEHTLPLPPPCGSCYRAQPARPAAAVRRHAKAPLPEGRARTEGPTTQCRAVQAWADDYLRYGAARPPWQHDLRNDLRTLLRKLKPSAGQILHATFVGDRPDDSDVENLLLYNIDAFKTAGANGIRFEQGTEVPPASDGADYPFYYRYELQPASAGFKRWHAVRELASFDWVELGAFPEDRRVAQVWLALKRNHTDTVAPIPLRAGTPFAVTVTIRSPHTVGEPRPDLKMKNILDGVIASFQAHTDTAVLADVAARLATALPAPSTEIAHYLSDERRAVLGTVPQLVRPHRPAGTWNPGDHWCLAGELLPAEPVDKCWAIRGQIVEISREVGSR